MPKGVGDENMRTAVRALAVSLITGFLLAGQSDPSQMKQALASAGSDSWKTRPKVAIPGGSYSIGVDGGEYALPPNKVALRDFMIDEMEVSMADYAACVTAGQCNPAGAEHEEHGWRWFCNWQVPGKETHPMNCVTWTQAKEYCEAVGERLPTEAEWEVAACGHLPRRYPDAHALEFAQRERHGNLGHQTNPVNLPWRYQLPFGILEMGVLGVCEWIGNTDVGREGASNDERERNRVLRGGPMPCSTVRIEVPADTRSASRGFRCAVSANTNDAAVPR
jgi:formylglycine-generating enzyme required for sulfatase activity